MIATITRGLILTGVMLAIVVLLALIGVGVSVWQDRRKKP